MPNLSILDKVKNRLLGGGDASDEDENTNPDDEVLDKIQKIVHPSTGSAFQLLPQLEVDETEFSNNLSTQVIPKMKPTQRLRRSMIQIKPKSFLNSMMWKVGSPQKIKLKRIQIM